MPMPLRRRLLVIKLSALGDVVQAIPFFQAIRHHHPADHITLLTTAPYVELAQTLGLFNNVWSDARPKFWNVMALARLKNQLGGGRFDRVYDLQNNDRTGFYYGLFRRPKPEWIGGARGASHFYDRAIRKHKHSVARFTEQLARGNITHITAPDLSFIPPLSTALHLPREFAVIVPGASPQHPAKRWPAQNFKDLCRYLLTTQHLTPVLIGGRSDQALCDAIAAGDPRILNRAGQTRLVDLFSLFRHARLAVGNDTGPMHIAPMAGCPSVVLFSKDSTPALHAPHPWSAPVHTVHRDDLAALSVDEVIANLLKTQ